MRVVFLGTPEFAVPSLEALVAAGHDVVGVVTQPDRPSGRGRTPQAPPVKRTALARGIPVLQPPTLRSADAVAEIRALAPDAMTVVAFGEILRRSVLSIAPLGCLNVHPSLLPAYRGPSPIPAAILDGLETTGVTIILMDERMDAGPILAQRPVQIRPDDTAGSLSARLSALGAQLLVDTLEQWGRHEIQPMPQDERLATYTRLLRKEDGWIDWELPAERLARQVRAYDPWPGTFTLYRGQLLKVLAATADATAPGAPPGTIVDLVRRATSPAIAVATGSGTLLITRLQLAGRKPVGATEFVQGQREAIGTILQSEPLGT